MLRLFKKKSITDKHQCAFNKQVGKYYIWYRTTYKNSFDTIIVYQRMKCSCGKMIDITISKQTFLPSLYFGEYKCAKYIKELAKRGVHNEFEINFGMCTPRGAIPKK